jgi:hypothetical protein
VLDERVIDDVDLAGHVLLRTLPQPGRPIPLAGRHVSHRAVDRHTDGRCTEYGEHRDKAGEHDVSRAALALARGDVFEAGGRRSVHSDQVIITFWARSNASIVAYLDAVGTCRTIVAVAGGVAAASECGFRLCQS